MDRNLDGVYLRVKRDGKWQSICFSDLTKEEMEQALENRTKEWIIKLCIHLGETIKTIGDMFCIVSERE